MELGQLIDLLYQTRQERLELTKKVDELKAEEAATREKLLDMLKAVGLQKASGNFATVGVKTTTVPLVTEWELVHEYIRREDRFDLLQKRLSAPAWRELFEQGIVVPGTHDVVETDLSLTKSTR
jgi:hypothetical protein